MAYKLPFSVLVVIHTAELEVLLIERADRPGFWQSVTGSLHEGETCREAAVREVGEETGIDAARYPLEDWRVQNRFEIFRRWGSRFAPGTTHNVERVFGLTLPQRVARVFERRGNLKSLPPPVPIPPAEVAVHWHERFEGDPGNRWLRDLMTDLYS